MCVKHIEMKVNLELCLVGGYTFQQYFMLYDELPTRFVIEPFLSLLSVSKVSPFAFSTFLFLLRILNFELTINTEMAKRKNLFYSGDSIEFLQRKPTE